MATNPAGQVVWRWEGRAFGETAPNEDPGNTGTPTTVNLRYPGQYYDQETGLYYNWHRYYDPRLGRYITSDPIGLEGGLNTFSYVANNPLRFTDPSGLLLPAALGAGAGVEGLVNLVGGLLAWNAITNSKVIPFPAPTADPGAGTGSGTQAPKCPNDDDVDCQEWLDLLKQSYEQILKMGESGRDTSLLRSQHDKSVGLFCQTCPSLCNQAPRFRR